MLMSIFNTGARVRVQRQSGHLCSETAHGSHDLLEKKAKALLRASRALQGLDNCEDSELVSQAASL
jgi:hypothetical protein